jgi:hypothetical protein
MASCFESMPALDCSKDVLSNSACYCAIQGTVPEGEKCLTELECGRESRCVPPGVGVCATGACTRRRGLNEPCTGDKADECAFDLDCARNPGSGGFQCTARVAEGGACSLVNEPSCSGLLVCRATSSLTGTCERPKLVEMGELCALSDGITCREGACVITER